VTKLALPVIDAGLWNRGFWYNSQNDRHEGIDYGWYNADPAGSQRVFAAAAGKVVSVNDGGGYNGGWGNRVVIEHAGGSRTGYNHLATGQIKVWVGKTVGKGELIAMMGNTGDSQGTHLHFEFYMPNGDRVDPKPYFTKDMPGSGTDLEANERQVVSGGGYANARTAASLKGAIVADKAVQSGDTGRFKGYVVGEKVSQGGVTTDIWFVGYYSSLYFWAGSFVGGANTTGLANLTPKPTEPETKPTTPTEPVPIWEPKDPDIVQPTFSNFPDWILYDEVRDAADDREDINKEAYDYYKAKGQDRQYYPEKQIAHWWGEPGAYSHDSVVNTFLSKADYAVHFVTSAENGQARITAMQKLDLVAYTTGSASMFGWSSETDPLLTDLDYLTLGYLTYIIEKLNPRLRRQTIELHKNQINVSTGKTFETACSNIDTVRLRQTVEDFFSGTLDPATGKAPVAEPTDPTPTDPGDVKPPEWFINWIRAGLDILDPK